MENYFNLINIFIMTSTDLIVIDSKSRSSGTSNNLSVSLDENVNGTYALSTFSMTNNLYNVVLNENDKMYMVHSVDGANTLTLTPGTYNSATLLTEVKVQLDSVSGVVYTITYGSTTGKYTFTPNSGNLNFAFLSNTTASCRYLLGFNEADGIPAASIVSDNPIDLKLHDIIAIKIAQDNNAHLTLPGGTEASVLIPLEASILFGQVIHYQRNRNFGQFVKFSSEISNLDISLFAGDGDLLPNNGAEWCLSISKLF